MIEEMTKTKIIRKTESRCHKCRSRVEAAVVQRQGKVFLDKHCPKHGLISVLVSDDACAYNDLENFYFAVMTDELKLCGGEIDLTFRCNMNCPICACDSRFKRKMDCIEPSVEEIRRFLEKSNVPVVKLSGGDPTCRSDLFDIVRLIKSFKKVLVINTNGLKLADFEYADRLKQAGVDTVNISLDGFDPKVEEYFRGRNYLQEKLAALNNLRRLDIPTGLNITVAKNVNEQEIPKLIDYAAKNEHIKLLSFGTFSCIGNAYSWDFSNYLMPDQLKDMIVRSSSGRISGESIKLFQKLFIAVNSFFSQRVCLYDSGATILLRENGSYSCLEKHMDLKAIEAKLDAYARIFRKNPLLAKWFLVAAGLLGLKEIKSWRMLKELLLRGLSFFSRNNKYLNTRSMVYININTICDNYKLDYGIAKNCMYGLVFKDKDNALKFRGTGSQVCDRILNSEFESGWY